MASLVRLIVCAFMGFWPLVGAASAPIAIDLQSSDKWQLNYREGSCELERSFGTGDEAITSLFSRTAPGDRFNLMLFGKLFAADGPYQDLRIAFGPEPAEEPYRNTLSGMDGKIPFAQFLAFTLAGRPRVTRQNRDELMQTEEPKFTPDQEAAVTLLTIGPKRGKVYRLQLGSMQGPMQAMRICTDDLVRQWGYDPAIAASLTRRVMPVGNPGAWIASSDYPNILRARGELGTVEIRIDVDMGGKPTNCAILQLIGSEQFGKSTCELVLRRAQFTPALDRGGNAVRGFWITKVHFSMLG